MRPRAAGLLVVLLSACVVGGDPEPGTPDPERDPRDHPAGEHGGPRESRRTWQAPQQLADGVYRLEAAGDDAGVVTALWSRVEDPGRGIWTATYRPAGGWDAPLPLAPSDEIGVIDVDADRVGSALALWTSWVGGPHLLYSARRDGVHGWGAVERLDVDDAAGVRDAGLATTRDGDAVAVWVVASFPDHDLYARRFDVGSGWSAPVRVTAGPSHALTVQVTIDDYGIATAAWYEEPGRLMSARWEPGAAWSAPVMIAAVFEPVRARLVVDRTGAVTAVWPDGCVHASRRPPFDGWSAPTCISAAQPWPNRVRLDESRGVIQAVWTQSTATGAQAWTNRFDGTAWGLPFLLEDQGVEYQAPDVGLDAGGGAVAVWSQHVGSEGWVRARRLDLATGWGATDQIAQQPGFPQESRVAVAASGVAQALWTLMRPEGDLHWSLWTATYE